jgi:alpha-tubulin suppressor-like RCC1 family protein
VATDGTTYCWGSNYQGSIYPDRYLLSPTLLAGDPGFRTVNVGGFSVCGIGPGGAVHCWGRNTRGQVGNGTTDYVQLPAAVLTERTFVSVSAGGYHTCAVTVEAAISGEGAVYCWGSNTSGQLGNGSNHGGWSIPVTVWKP